MPVSSESGATAAAAAEALPHRLRRSVGRAQPLAAPQALRTVATPGAGEEASRESLAGLYALATRLRSPALRYHSKSLETSAARHVTTEQIWGQMAVLLRPVLRQLQGRVKEAEKRYGKPPKTPKADNKSTRKQKTPDDDDENKEEEEEEKEDDILSTRTSQLSESDLDEEIAELLRSRQRRRREGKDKASSSASAGGGGGGDGNNKKGDDWRYVFGKSTGDGDDDDDDWGDAQPQKRLDSDNEEDAFGHGGSDGEGEGEEEVDERQARRNARAMLDAEAEDGDEGDAEEELAALKEMYGEDFEDDGQGLLGDGSDGDLELDMEEDHPSLDGGEEGGAGGYTDRDGQYWGKDDMLNDLTGVFEAPGAPYAGGGGGEGEGDEEGEEEEDAALAAALADPNLTALQRERIREKHHVDLLEQKRLFSTDWAMAGETAANKRPREALLDEELEVEYGMKAAPVVTEFFTAKLEERIKRRIAEARYDDVTKPVALSAPGDVAAAGARVKSDAALDAQQSKLSLMDLYEKEYLERARKAAEAAGDDAPTAEPLTEIEKDELRAVQMWKRLSQHLDALSNFHFTPKPAQEDLEARVRAVDQRAPAIAVETVGNFATTREAALAPQDLYRGSSRKFAGVGSDELLPSERRALRRSKKEGGAHAKQHTERTRQKQREAKSKTSAAATSAAAAA